MNLKQLEAFVSVAQYKSFSRAAAALYLTQPTVSAHVSALEREWGVRLFTRTTKTVELTPMGCRLYEIARKMTQLEEELEACLRQEETQRRLPVRVAASTVPGQYLLPHILSRFGKEHADVHIVLSETDSRGVVDMILHGRADVGFCGTKWSERGLTYEPVYEDTLVWIMPNREPYASYVREKRPPATWIRQERFIMREAGSGTRKEVERCLEQMGVSPGELRAGMTTESPEMIRQLVKSGAGISVVSGLVVRDLVRRGELLALPFLPDTADKRGAISGGGGTRSIYMVCQGRPGADARTLMDLSRTLCGSFGNSEEERGTADL